MDTKMIDSSILEMMASRICHDLISPVGAVSNGVEFLQEDMGSDDVGDAISLIAMSAESAATRLQVFRFAYGTGGRDATIKPTDIHKSFGDFLACENKVTQDWDGHAVFANYDRAEGFGKLLMCCLMMAQEALPKGGIIRVTHDDTTTITTISAEGHDANIRPQVDAALKLDLDPSVIDPRLVHPYITGVLAAQYGHKVTIGAQEEGKVSFSLVKQQN